MKKIHVGLGSCTAGSPFEQGQAAARDALDQAQPLSPALALLVGLGHEARHAAEILRGAREALGDCPLMGRVSLQMPPAGGSSPPAGVRVFLMASSHLRAKVGIGEAVDGGGWERAAHEAFRDSFIPAAVPRLPDAAAEGNFYHWYLYHRPSLVLAAVISPSGHQNSREMQVAAFLKRKLYGRVPLLMLSLPAAGEAAALLAGGRVITSGVVLAMIKTDLKFSLERFHSFEPVGVKLFVTRAEGNRIFECNRRPAIEAYREALGLDPAVPTRSSEGLGPFSLFPLAHRSRDGRYNLLVPEEIGADGSIGFSAAVAVDRVLYPMKAVPSSDLWRPSARQDALIPDAHKLAAAIFMRDTGLRDLPEVLPSARGALGAVEPLDLPCGRELKAFLSSADVEGEAGHLLLTIERELDPFAVAATENERLVGEVVRLRDLHQKIFDNIGYGIAVVDASRRILFCNGTYRILLTGGPAPLEGQTCPWSGCGTAACGTCACEEAMALDAPVNREVVRLKGGKAHSYRLDTFPLRDASGKVTAAIEVMRDVTAFKDLRLSLESEQRKMEAVIRGMGETLYIVDAGYELQFFHRGLFPVTAGVDGNVRNRKCHEALFRRNLPCPWCRMHETLLSGKVERRVAHLPDSDGEDRSYQVSFSPCGVGPGEQPLVVCLLVDISAQKRLEQQMVLSEKLNSLSILSAGMAHELNNPLGAISFNLEILKRREKDAEYQEVLESIRKDVFRINRIVGNLLSFSRSGAPSSGWIALPAAIDAALELFQVVIERRRIGVHRSYTEGLQPVWGNAQDLQQVFINFIANAVDAMPSGGTIDIAVGPDEKLSETEDAVRIAVVYDTAADLTLLRKLTDNPGWEVRFHRGDGEAIDSFRRSSATPPEVLLLDFADTKQDQVDFFVMMAKEYAPDARVLAIAGPGGGDRRWTPKPGVDGVLPRPPAPEDVLQRVNDLVATLRSQRRGRAAVVVRFEDTGIGIPPEIQERIFDPFFTTKETKGTGLGLSVVHKILQDHGASVRVSSTIGKGTRFTLKFPEAKGAGSGISFPLRRESSLAGGER